MEYFGGLLIDIDNSEFYQIPLFESLFLCILECVGDFNIAKKIIDNRFSHTHKLLCCLKKYLKNKILCISNKESRPYSNYEIDEILNEFELCQKKDHLNSPISISVYPTLYCQLNCSFCFIKNSSFINYLPLSIDNFKKIIDEISVLKIPYISILGGEPTLYPYLCEILKYIIKKKISVNITSNGVNVNEKIISIIKKNNRIGITISIQSLDEYNKITTGEDFKIVCDTIKLLKNKCKINSVYQDQTDEQLFNLLNFCNKLGIKSISFSIYNKIDQPVEEEIKRFKKFIKLYRILNEYKKENKIKTEIRLEGCCQYLFFKNLKGLPKSPQQILFSKCEAAFTKMEILPDGSAMPCIILGKDAFLCGNVFEKGIKKVWHEDEMFKELRQVKMQDKECLNCKYIDFCNGGCPAKKWTKNKNLEKVRDERCLERK